MANMKCKIFFQAIISRSKMKRASYFLTPHAFLRAWCDLLTLFTVNVHYTHPRSCQLRVHQISDPANGQMSKATKLTTPNSRGLTEGMPPARKNNKRVVQNSTLEEKLFEPPRLYAKLLLNYLCISTHRTNKHMRAVDWKKNEQL